MISENSNQFPKDFLWGAATSAHQVEGGNVGNDWYAAEGVGHVPPAGLACDSYNRYEEDFDLAVALGHNSHRLGLEWSRIEPRMGEWDLAEVAHYRKVLQALKDRHLKSFVTLWHFTLPRWIVGAGWESSQTVSHFVRYAVFCAEQFGDLVDFWITQNEPTQVYSLMGYLTGEWPPFKKLVLWSYLKVWWHLGQAHNQAYNAIKKVLPQAQVGIVENFGWTEGRLAKIVNFFNHRVSLFLVQQHLDFLGVNHYNYHQIHFDLQHGLKINNGLKGFPVDGKLWVSDLGWTLYPRAIYNVLLNLSSSGLTRGPSKQPLPIYITENGLADEKDVSRQKFIEETLQWVKKALDEGVDVRGYLHWSLLDNYEWAEGYQAKFGLVAVDFANSRKRTIRPSALWLKDFITNTVDFPVITC